MLSPTTTIPCLKPTMTPIAEEYPTFAAFVERVVLPGSEANLDYKRLDGWPSGGNLEVAGRFWRDGMRWKVHSDTHFEPMLMAYGYEQEGQEPFEHGETKNGRSLVLTEKLQAARNTPHRHLYIYED